MNHAYAGSKEVSRLSTDDTKFSIDSVEVDKVVDCNGCDLRSLKANVGYCSNKVLHCKCFF